MTLEQRAAHKRLTSQLNVRTIAALESAEDEEPVYKFKRPKRSYPKFRKQCNRPLSPEERMFLWKLDV